MSTVNALFYAGWAIEVCAVVCFICALVDRARYRGEKR
jgi:hypothetical protein